MNKLLIVDTDVDAYVEEIKGQNLTDLTFWTAASPDDGHQMINEVNIVLGRPAFVAELLPNAEKLAWVQSTFAGVEALCGPTLRKDYILTGVKDVFGPLISEYTMAYLLAMERHLFDLRDQQSQKRWHTIPYRSLDGLTLGIAGLGSIGQHLARTAAHFGMRVTGLKQGAGAVSHVATVYSPAQLDQFLPQLDYLVLALPDTPATRNMIDAEALGLMKPSAVLLNVGRGTAVDQKALTEALQRKSISAAVLDVFESEPLEQGDPLWEMPNAFITPHCAAHSFPSQIAAIFCENYRRFIKGKPLMHSIDFERGY